MSEQRFSVAICFDTKLAAYLWRKGITSVVNCAHKPVSELILVDDRLLLCPRCGRCSKHASSFNT